MTQIKFLHNWNNKLNCTIFSTIRKSKDYWVNQQNKPIEIILNDVSMGDAILYKIITVKFKDIRPATIEIDTGMEFSKAIKLFKNFGIVSDTHVDILYFTRNNLSNPTPKSNKKYDAQTISSLLEINKKEVFEKAHLEESSGLARQYFKGLGLGRYDITENNCSMLRVFIDREINILLADTSYSMIKNLRTNSQIKFDKTEVCLYVDGAYFKKRNAITFEFYNNNFIRFCGWASGCNRIPFIKGFIYWCDWVIRQKNKGEP